MLVIDQLNTHSPASLNQAFPPAKAKRLADTLEIHYTSKYGSCLNIAEIELSAATPVPRPPAAGPGHPGTRSRGRGHCANRRLGRIDWRFTTDDARIKLKSLYSAKGD
jgi:hypothetical protein